MIYTEPDAREVLTHLHTRTDAKAPRVRELRARPDLTREPSSPVKCTVDIIKRCPSVARADPVEIPDIVPVTKNFDLLGVPTDHPSRRPSDTFYVDDTHVLRTQTTTMWSYYLKDPRVRRMLETGGTVRAVCHGKVYRNDDIDRWHYPVFHQIDGLQVTQRSDREYTVDDLVAILVQIARAVFGESVEYRVTDDYFPFTHPSRQLEILQDGESVEILGSGLVRPEVLERLGIDVSRYNGWAFGFGIDRLAMLKHHIPDIRVLWSTDERVTRQLGKDEFVYEPVSTFPPTDRDISFLVDTDMSLLAVYEIVRQCGVVDGEDVVEEVLPLDRYENAGKFGTGRVSHTLRIRYRSHTRTLTNEEINDVQSKVRARVATELNAQLR